MAWTTNQVTQNGNTTVNNWTITGGALSRHDAVVINLRSSNSGVRLNSVTVRLTPSLRYVCSVSVVGGEAAAFRFSAEQMD